MDSCKASSLPSGYSNRNVSRVGRDLSAAQEVKLSRDRLQQQQQNNLNLQQERFFTV